LTASSHEGWRFQRSIAARYGDLLHRVLIELRSFDNLLAFRFG